jgi:tetratricopeptide (TPR) repeat protein
MHTRGNTQEVRDAIERGLDLSEAHGGDLTQLRLLGGLNLFLTRLGDFEGGLAAARRCGAIAERSGTLVDRIIAEWMLAAAYHLAGNQATALEHCQRGFELEADIGRLQINLFGYDHHLRAELALARSLWLTGAPLRARRLALEAMEHAARSPLPGDYTMAAAHGIPVLLWSGETEESSNHIERLISHTERHSFASHAAAAWALKGEWLLMTGQPSSGIETLRRALSMLQREQFHMVIPAAWTALADGLVRCGSHAEARETIDTAISSAPQMGQRFWLPSLLRMQGEVSLNGPRPDAEAAEKAFRASIDFAREQGALGWELKAALPLARFLLEQGRPADALATLQPIYSAFPEKTGTHDLVEAEQILASLG